MITVVFEVRHKVGFNETPSWGLGSTQPCEFVVVVIRCMDRSVMDWNLVKVCLSLLHGDSASRPKACCRNSYDGGLSSHKSSTEQYIKSIGYMRLPCLICAKHKQ